MPPKGWDPRQAERCAPGTGPGVRPRRAHGQAEGQKAAVGLPTGHPGTDAAPAARGNRGLPAPTRARSLGSLLQAPTPHLLAVQVARKRLPPRTTSTCPHTASPAKLAMSPAVAPLPTCAAQSLFLAARASDVTGQSRRSDVHPARLADAPALGMRRTWFHAFPRAGSGIWATRGGSLTKFVRVESRPQEMTRARLMLGFSSRRGRGGRGGSGSFPCCSWAIRSAWCLIGSQ